MSQDDDGYLIRIEPDPQKGGFLASLFRCFKKGSGETQYIKSARGESPDQALRELGASGEIKVRDDRMGS